MLIKTGSALSNWDNGQNSYACWAYVKNLDGRRLLYCIIYDVLGSELKAECIVDDFGNIVKRFKE